jgi:hypothetical protein
MNDSLAIFKANITKLLTPMEVPAMRRNLDKPENIHWLIRSLGYNNSSHQDYKETMSQLSLLSKIISFKALVARTMSDAPLPTWIDRRYLRANRLKGLFVEVKDDISGCSATPNSPCANL